MICWNSRRLSFSSNCQSRNYSLGVIFPSSVRISLMTKQHLMLCFEYLFQPSQFTKFKDYFISTVVWWWQVYDTYLRYLYLTTDKHLQHLCNMKWWKGLKKFGINIQVSSPKVPFHFCRCSQRALPLRHTPSPWRYL